MLLSPSQCLSVCSTIAPVPPSTSYCLPVTHPSPVCSPELLSPPKCFLVSPTASSQCIPLTSWSTPVPPGMSYCHPACPGSSQCLGSAPRLSPHCPGMPRLPHGRTRGSCCSTHSPVKALSEAATAASPARTQHGKVRRAAALPRPDQTSFFLTGG